MINPHLIIATLCSIFAVSAARSLQNSELKRWTIIDCSNNGHLEHTSKFSTSLSDAAINLTSVVLPQQNFWLQLSGTLDSKNCPLYSNVLYKVTSEWQYKTIEVDDATDNTLKKTVKRLEVGYEYDSIGMNKTFSCYHEHHVIQLKGKYDYGFASCLQNKKDVFSARDKWHQQVPFPYFWEFLKAAGASILFIIVFIIIGCFLKRHTRGRFNVQSLFPKDDLKDRLN